MAEWSASNPEQRANQVWERLLGCFGDSLIRKFDERPPPEWVAGLSTLNDYQLAQGMRRLVYSGKAHPPTLPEFMKLCRTIGFDDNVPDEIQRPRLPMPDDGFDGWAVLANRRLLRHITTVIPANPQRYGVFPTIEAMKDPERAHLVNADAGAEFVNSMHILAAFKNQWADLMRDAATEEGVPLDEQDAAWDTGIRQAEEQILKEMPQW